MSIFLKTSAALLLCLLAVLGLASCPGPGATAATSAVPVTLNISAASSLTDALKEINALYVQGRPHVTITPNFAGSGTLQQQIENGAPCDVFISAAATQMDNLQNKGFLLEGSRKNLLINKLVLIVPSDSTLGIASFNDLAGEGVKRIAIGDPASVPAGSYAQQAFDLLGISAGLKPRLVLGGNVRQVLTYVETGDVDAGIVFATDALTSSKVKVAAGAPQQINAKIVYPVAVTRASTNAAAAGDYIDFLSSTAARAVFEKYGFSMANN